MEKTKEEFKIATGKLIRNASVEHDTNVTPRPSMGNQRKPHDFKIVVKTGSNPVNQVFFRFGKKVGEEYEWGPTTAMPPYKIESEQEATVAMMDDDQIPASAKFCQLLCEIDNEHGDPEILMTEPTSLASDADSH